MHETWQKLRFSVFSRHAMSRLNLSAATELSIILSACRYGTLTTFRPTVFARHWLNACAMLTVCYITEKMLNS